MKRIRDGWKFGDFDIEYYVNRNRIAALNRFGSLLDSNRRVKGTDIWFDQNWVFHKGDDYGPSEKSEQMDKR